MFKETEIKLRISDDTLTALREHPLVQERQQTTWQTKQLINQYFDTPQQSLAAAKVALRLRRDGDQIIQTLKTRGNSVAGLSERNEWEWHLDKMQLDTSVLHGEYWPEALAGCDLASLQPLFSNDFSRQHCLLAWQRDGEQVVVDMALDQGAVKTANGEEPISELELEMREGSSQALFELAAELAEDLPLMPCDISKAERGYRLLDAGSYQLRPAHLGWSAELPVDEVIARAGWTLLGHSQRLAEQFRFSGQWRHFRELVVQLDHLRAYFSVFDLALPRSAGQPFVTALDDMLNYLHPLYLAGWADDAQGQDARAEAPEIFARLSNELAWGQLFIGLALWLQQKRWTENRPPRGERVAALPMERWLLGAVSKEIQALRVPHNNDGDERVSEWCDQLPRLQRLHFLLNQFRRQLKVAEADRLFGELSKLQELLQQTSQVDASQRDALLATLRKQGLRIRRLSAWRELNG
ncbi:CYTH domain-containing protein [Halopseudomonas salegens]|uniref:Inorganic triphosphatase YgiF, contains CYTH and CHAD domains n=1 Tax=Halopseudomonas salegens TaxID=1434072 RepID=A0A1H2GZU3_9GAMM|nr:CYTH and CHAD domain-containing protein [Halopseudomonas salegens]SDU25140.1 Inorganic triphosphatase YgiF, contains CYTH and CHAD domains [Halopseudomonas salegens]